MSPKPIRWYGKSTKGINRGFLSHLATAAAAQGAVGIYVISGKRTPATNTGVKNSNHLSGHAMDGYAIMADGSKVPLGSLLKSVAGQYGLRSGDQPGFYKGGPDPNHVDDGYNVRGGKPLAAETGTVAPDAATATGASDPDAGPDPYMQQQQYAAIQQIPQVGGLPQASAPLAGDFQDTSVTPIRSAGDTWQLIASQGNVSPDTIRLASLAGLGQDGSPSG